MAVERRKRCRGATFLLAGTVASAAFISHDKKLSFSSTVAYHNCVAERAKKTATVGPRRRRKAAGTALGLAPHDLQDDPPENVRNLQRDIAEDGGSVLAAYREPFGGKWMALAALPIDRVAATPYQRNLSDAHVRKLERVIAKIGRFLDPIIAVRAVRGDEAVRYWTPNGHHRLSAMKTLGAKSITALVVPETSVAYQILALNTEKAHNLRERALEVIRLYREFAALGDLKEDACGLEFEEPALITLGLCYERRPRFSGGAYHPILKQVDTFLTSSCRDTLAKREARAETLLQIDDAVIDKVDALKARGLSSPYLKNFLVARINPVRFRPKDAPALSFDDAMRRMLAASEKFNPDKIRTEDIARSGGPPTAEE